MEAGRYRVENRAFPRTRALYADLSGTRANGIGAENMESLSELSKGQLSFHASLRSLHTRYAWRYDLHPRLRVERVSSGVSSSLHASRVQTCLKS